jgi:hypothetical protein
MEGGSHSGWRIHLDHWQDKLVYTGARGRVDLFFLPGVQGVQLQKVGGISGVSG